jgi:hypothetical protein
MRRLKPIPGTGHYDPLSKCQVDKHRGAFCRLPNLYLLSEPSIRELRLRLDADNASESVRSRLVTCFGGRLVARGGAGDVNVMSIVVGNCSSRHPPSAPTRQPEETLQPANAYLNPARTPIIGFSNSTAPSKPWIKLPLVQTTPSLMSRTALACNRSMQYQPPQLHVAIPCGLWSLGLSKSPPYFLISELSKNEQNLNSGCHIYMPEHQV